MSDAPNSISAGAPPQTPGGAYSAPPDFLAGFKGPTSKEGGGGKEKRGREGRPPIFFPSRRLWGGMRVRPSVCLSHAGIDSKLITVRRIMMFHRLIVQGYIFWDRLTYTLGLIGLLPWKIPPGNTPRNHACARALAAESHQLIDRSVTAYRQITSVRFSDDAWRRTAAGCRPAA